MSQRFSRRVAVMGFFLLAVALLASYTRTRWMVGQAATGDGLGLNDALVSPQLQTMVMDDLRPIAGMDEVFLYSNPSGGVNVDVTLQFPAGSDKSQEEAATASVFERLYSLKQPIATSTVYVLDGDRLSLGAGLGREAMQTWSVEATAKGGPPTLLSFLQSTADENVDSPDQAWIEFR